MALLDELKGIKSYNDFGARCEEFGIFTNVNTLEVDLFEDDYFTGPIIETLRETKWSEARAGWIDGWEATPSSLNKDDYLTLIDVVGKGRFAQRLASRIEGIVPPDYIGDAIRFVADRV